MFIGLMFALSWQLSLISLTLGLVFMLFMTLYSKNMSKLGKAQIEIGRKTSGSLQEALSGIELIKSYAREQNMVSSMDGLIKEQCKMSYRISIQTEYASLGDRCFGRCCGCPLVSCFDVSSMK